MKKLFVFAYALFLSNTISCASTPYDEGFEDAALPKGLLGNAYEATDYLLPKTAVDGTSRVIERFLYQKHIGPVAANPTEESVLTYLTESGALVKLKGLHTQKYDELEVLAFERAKKIADEENADLIADLKSQLKAAEIERIELRRELELARADQEFSQTHAKLLDEEALENVEQIKSLQEKLRESKLEVQKLKEDSKDRVRSLQKGHRADTKELVLSKEKLSKNNSKLIEENKGLEKDKASLEDELARLRALCSSQQETLEEHRQAALEKVKKRFEGSRVVPKGTRSIKKKDKTEKK